MNSFEERRLRTIIWEGIRFCLSVFFFSCGVFIIGDVITKPISELSSLLMGCFLVIFGFVSFKEIIKENQRS